MTTQGIAEAPADGGRAKEATQAAASTAADRGGDVVQTAKSQVQEVAAEAKSQVSGLAQETRGQVQQQADSQRERVVTFLREFGDELSQLADKGGQNGPATQVVRQVSSRVLDVSGAIDARDVSDLLDQVRSFARRRPGAFVLGAAAVGVLAGRATRGVRSATSSNGNGSPSTSSNGNGSPSTSSNGNGSPFTSSPSSSGLSDPGYTAGYQVPTAAPAAGYAGAAETTTPAGDDVFTPVRTEDGDVSADAEWATDGQRAAAAERGYRP